jgi:hypothetical protein
MIATANRTGLVNYRITRIVSREEPPRQVGQFSLHMTDTTTCTDIAKAPRASNRSSG